MANAYFYSNVALPTTLSGSITAGATTFNVAGTSGFPAVPFVLALDYGASTEELVKVTAISGNTITNCDRGFGGTSAQSHSLGAAVRHVYNSVDATDFRTHEAASAAVHGLTGTVVGTSDTQTLTNKTLTTPTINGAVGGTQTYTSPTINGATLSGTVAGTPTFTGNLTFSGSPTFTGSPVFSTGTPDFQNGFDWGGTTITGAATLSGSNVLTNQARIERANASDNALVVGRTGATSHLVISAEGDMSWGDGNNPSTVTLERSTVNGGLLTNNHLAVGGNFSAAGIGNIQAKRRSVDLTRSNNSVLASDSELTFTVVPGTYIITGQIYVASNAASAGINTGFNIAATGNLNWSAAGAHNSITTGSQADGEWIARVGSSTAIPFGTSTTGSVDLGITIGGSFLCTVGGAFDFAWAQRVSSATGTTLRTGSWMRLERIA